MTAMLTLAPKWSHARGNTVVPSRWQATDCDREFEVRRQVPADFLPRLPRIVAAHDVPMLLHEQHLGSCGVHGDTVHAMADLGLLVR